MKTIKLLFVLIITMVITSTLFGKIIYIPDNYLTIQEGVDAAISGDTVLVAPDTYYENIKMRVQAVILSSWFVTTGDTDYITYTIIDGIGQDYAISIPSNASPMTSIIGFTIQNADDGIAPYSKFNCLNNRIIQCKDGIDYENNSGGICSNNVFENNRDDGIDLDGSVDIIIEDNIIRNNRDDGIEIRLQKHSGNLLTCIIRGNNIYNNGEDGIQFIDYTGISNRVFYIEHNLIYNNDMVGLGCMGNENTKENYEGASITEPIYLFNNTFADNNYGITGGDDLVALNNIIVNHKGTAMKNVDGNSIISYCIFWKNGMDFIQCNKDEPNLFFVNPGLSEDFRLQKGSPCINRGTDFFIWNQDTVLILSPADYIDSGPDIGAFEYNPETGVLDNYSQPLGYSLSQNYPNPFNSETSIHFNIGQESYVGVEIYNSAGQKIKKLLSNVLAGGEHCIMWNGTDSSGKGVSSGVYFYTLCVEGSFCRTSRRYVENKKMILLK